MISAPSLVVMSAAIDEDAGVLDPKRVDELLEAEEDGEIDFRAVTAEDVRRVLYLHTYKLKNERTFPFILTCLKSKRGKISGWVGKTSKKILVQFYQAFLADVKSGPALLQGQPGLLV